MATPTQMKHAASQQGRTPSQLTAATPPVSTPFSASQAHAAFSPRGPRSSPQQFKKSPATSTTLMGHPANGALNFDSPSAAAAMGALGISGGLDIGLDHVGVGGFGGLGGLGSEDDKIKRLDAVIEILGKAKGRVSEAGLERLTVRSGLTSMWDEHRSPDGRKTKMLVIAGQALTLDIVLNNNIVENVSLAFPESAPIVSRHTDKAGKILLKDLQLRPDQSPLTKTLDKFAANMERLANLDKLSVIPGFDCQEALAGIFESLERLHKWELSKLREDPAMSGKPDRFLETTTMCARSGRPMMHARGMVGLSIEYWTERRHVIPKTSDTERFCEKMEKVWSILIGCKALDGEMFQPVRVSENWISQKVVAEPGPDDILAGGSGLALDWQEPEATSLPQTDDNKDKGMNVVHPDGTTHKLPNVKFVATLTPSVIVPQSVWNTLHNLTGAAAQPMLLPTCTFDSISFPIPEGSNHEASELRVISCRRTVQVPSNGNVVSRKHKNTLLIYKPVYGQTVTELSFSHPRQLVDMLPILRQYSLISTLLERSFGSDISGDALPEKDESIVRNETTMTAKEEYELFMSNKAPQGDDQELTIDVVLTVHPSAGLHVVFPFRNATANIDLQIQPNGVVHVVSQNVVPESGGDVPEADKGKGKQFNAQDLGKLLEVTEDLCSWAEWIRRNLS
ncbi:hypothetical protein CSOJ01_03099 [Colletotrichum sojae]|uniref:Mediator of RNA polymerase II transcription subunit 1 n=1 Tax=Colletotrichum sojae TaxID=2175907 RepID=A0A8H6JNH1_9PEZI|nr:hypothetical protein CSOJ01_03099 [Colletotrichum sojae]